MILNRTDNPINREGRNKLNENWETLERTYKKVVDDSNEALNTANQANAKSDNAVNIATQKGNEAIDIANQANNTSNYVQQQLDTVISESGDANPEVAQARADFVNLRERLDTEKAQFTTQLAQTKDEFNNLASDKADKTALASTNIEVAKKADRSFVDAQFASIVSGAPKGTYTNLTALQNAYPNGAEGVFLTLDNGHWHYWQATTSQWMDGGLYQAQGLADESVSPIKTTFLTEGTNKFDGNYINAAITTVDLDLSTMEIVESASGKTAIVPIKPNQTYTVRFHDSSNRRRMGLLNSYPVITETPLAVDTPLMQDDNYIGPYTFTSTSASKYLIVYASSESQEPRLQVQEGENDLPYEGYKIDFKSPANKDKFEKIEKILNDNAIELYGNYPLVDFNYIERKVNLFNTRALFNGQRTVINNEIVDMLPIDESRLYQLLYLDTSDSTAKIMYFAPTTQLKVNEKPIALLHPNDAQKINLINLDNCYINGKPFVRTHLRDIIKAENGYFIFDSIDGVYKAPRNLTDVSATLETSNVDFIYLIYDDLVARYPSYVSKKILGNDTTGLPIYEYKFTSQRINNESTYKFNVPKIALMTAIHGYEQGSAYCLAQFFKDLCDNVTDTRLAYMRNNIDFVVVPVANPYGYNNNQRTNVNLVDLNRNFNANWTQTTQDGDANGSYSGATAASEVETQILSAWLDENLDAEWFIDYHNIANGYPLFYLYDDKAATIALNTFKTLTREWRNEYSAASKTEMHGYVETGVNAAASTYMVQRDVKTFVFETPWRMPWATAKYDKVTIETGIDAFANTLATIFKNL